MKNRNQGEEAESVVEQALLLLMKRNPFFVHMLHARKSGELDSNKIDFLIFLANFMALPLQVKSSRRGVKDHYKKCPYIIAIHVRKSHDAQKIANKIEHAVMRILKDPLKPRLRSALKNPVS
ncbi:MAG: hypothetical protein Q8P49_03315 [Candidatus Liptonbacteria bacterium]|nr:hypothetical protein [Candidatus Liptonbacteria bacterium]